nr:receptor-like protein kinase 2 [Quercus suber]
MVCGSTGTVSQIIISGANLNGTLAQFNFTPFLNVLSGPIPSEIGQLTELQYVSFYNSLNGFILDCQKLTNLDLSQNMLNGTVPEKVFSNLGKLKYLNLTTNLFKGPVSPKITKLSKLIDLRLGRNKFSVLIPEDIGSLSNLRIIELYNNLFEGRIPSSIGQLTELWLLDVRWNSLNFPIPSELGLCSNLTFLALASNPLTGELPLSLINLTKVTDLGLSDNKLSGKISPYFLSNLDRIDLIATSAQSFHMQNSIEN